MNRHILKICLVFITAFLSNIPSTLYSQMVVPEVLTLQETATFLKISSEEVEILATENSLPARKIGDKWRFSRTALVFWLSGSDLKYAYDFDSLCTSNKRTGFYNESIEISTLSQQELSGIKGHGTTADASNKISPNTSNKEDEIGYKPDFESAQNIFLRNETILLKPKDLSIEFGMIYSYSERLEYVFSDPILSHVITERETLISNLGLRYGLMSNLVLSVRLPYIINTDTLTLADKKIRDKYSNFRELSLGLSYSVLQEGLNKPEVILKLEGQVPVNKGSYSLGIGTAIVKSVDPLVFFADLNYKHTFSKTFDDLYLLSPEETFSVDVGYAYALNNTTSIGTLISGIFTGRTSFDNGVTVNSSKQFNLQFSLTSLFTKNMYIEPSITIGLNNSASDVIFGMNLVYTFEKHSK